QRLGRGGHDRDGTGQSRQPVGQGIGAALVAGQQRDGEARCFIEHHYRRVGMLAGGQTVQIAHGDATGHDQHPLPPQRKLLPEL
ncbi:hypothetical protein Q8G50_33175, partial [Klebsiella pneumoniae]